jgi:hypothetical protein
VAAAFAGGLEELPVELLGPVQQGASLDELPQPILPARPIV